MQYRALKTFRGRYGLIRAGMVVTLDDRYAAELLIGRKIERVALPQAAPKKQAYAEAVSFAAGEATPPSPAGGQGRPLSVRRPARRSRRPTSTPSEDGRD
jgi:hypothetical protein